LVWVGITIVVLGIFIIALSELLFIGVLLAGIGVIVIFANQAKEPKVTESLSVNKDDAHGRDPVLHYEVTKGHFGDPSKQSLTYKGKKTRWR